LDEPATDDEIRRLALTLNAMLARIQESFERQRAFVDHASHELRTPLANLSLELELAQRGERTREEIEAALVSVAHEVRHLDALASNLLVLARATDGRLPIVREATDLSEVVRVTASTFTARAAAQGVELEVEPGSTGVVLVDPVRMRQVVTNLVDNALRVTPRGGRARVAVRVGADEIRIQVSDTGPGFAEAVRNSAFEMFVRGTEDRATPGAGLGLAIVAAIAVAHGGRAQITSDGDGPPGPDELSGAEISVSLPLLRPSGEPSPPTPAPV
jgi:signal transduction histidine kinase